MPSKQQDMQLSSLPATMKHNISDSHDMGSEQVSHMTRLTSNDEEGGVLVGQVQGDQQAGPHELHGDLHLLLVPPDVQHSLLPRILLGGQVVEGDPLLLPVPHTCYYV